MASVDITLGHSVLHYDQKLKANMAFGGVGVISCLAFDIDVRQCAMLGLFLSVCVCVRERVCVFVRV